MSTFKVGTNLSNVLPDIFDNLNQKYTNKITEVYGSIQAHSIWAARPKFRLPAISKTEFENHVKLMHNRNIKFNYTLNAPFIGSSSEIEKRIDQLNDILYFLHEIGVDVLTITSPLLSRIIDTLHPRWFIFELSTIAGLNQVSQLRGYNTLGKFTRFCMNLEKNREFKFLKTCASVAKENNFVIDLMVNEFCSTSDTNFSCGCVLRQDCYNLHSVNETTEEYMKFDGYPMNLCMAGRKIEKYSWLRSRFILPQWLKYYNDIGITHFKITGRTGSDSYIEKITEAYMKESWTGNLCSLWKQLQSIYDGEKDSDNNYIDTYLNSDVIDGRGFLNHWKRPYDTELGDEDGFVCADVNCGVDCKYCQEFYEKYLRTT